MPSEPAEYNFKNKVHARAYTTHERGGIIWAYMGPREVPPPLPDIEANLLDQDPERILRCCTRQCNWMQGWEGEMDTVHAAFLHWGADKAEDHGRAAPSATTSQRNSARSSSKDTEFGAAYGAYRPAEDDSYYWRIGHMLFPFYAMNRTGELGPRSC